MSYFSLALRIQSPGAGQRMACTRPRRRMLRSLLARYARYFLNAFGLVMPPSDAEFLLG
jgi:hypothetical protein